MTTSLNLWKNRDGQWRLLKKVHKRIAASGSLRLQKKDHALEIICNDMRKVRYKLSRELLQGRIGIRSQGAKFKNFTGTSL